MKRSWTRAISLLLVVLMLAGCTAKVPIEKDNTQPEVEDGFTQEQKNTLAMLNYLGLVTEQIHSVSDSRLMLEEIYDALLNDFTISSIDNEANAYLDDAKNTIKNLLNIGARREYLQYVYNQEKAAAIIETVPHPLTIDTIASSGSPAELAIGTTLSVISAVLKYKAASDSAKNNYFLGEWELDEATRNEIYNSRDNLFNYMWNVVHANATAEEKVKIEALLLRENDIKRFVEICQDDNVQSRLADLVAKEETYAMFGNYWIELADCYFMVGNYEKCLDCVEKYQNLGITIFKRDFLIVSILPKAIVAAQNVYTGEEYINHIKTFADLIVSNTNDNEWSERYFAATAYVDLYLKTDDLAHLKTACNVIEGNVRQLAREQKKLNDTYLQDIRLIDISNGGNSYSQEDKNWVKAHNKALESTRKTELPTIYEPLIVNCELLFVLLEELDVQDSEKKEIQNILHGDTDVFLCDPIGNQFSFETAEENYIADFNKNEFMIPANLLHQGSNVVVSVVAGGETTVFNDVKITRVERSGQDVSRFKAYYSSDTLGKYKWSEDARITITIDNGELYQASTIQFRVSEYKDNWIFADTVKFEQVTK